MKTNWSSEVHAGIRYLDDHFDGWVFHVSLTDMHIYNPRTNILAQVRNEPLADTPEWLHCGFQWMRNHGFDADSTTDDWTTLDLEWILRIRELRHERSVSDAKGEGQ